MARVELDVRVRVGDGDWISPCAGEVTGDNVPEISAAIAVALRELADELEQLGAGDG